MAIKHSVRFPVDKRTFIFNDLGKEDKYQVLVERDGKISSEYTMPKKAFLELLDKAEKGKL